MTNLILGGRLRLLSWLLQSTAKVQIGVAWVFLPGLLPLFPCSVIRNSCRSTFWEYASHQLDKMIDVHTWRKIAVEWDKIRRSPVAVKDVCLNSFRNPG